MADHSKPTVTSLYSNFVAELDARLDDLAVMLDPARTTTSNIPTGAIRWASASSKWQLWNGSAWVDLAATYAINALTASSAAKWTTARTLSLSGDVTGSASVDGSANATISATLSNTGVAAGTYKSVTVDAKGRVTGATNPTTLAGYGITDAVPSADVAQVPAASKLVKATASGPIDLGWLDATVARELRMLAVGVNPSLDLNFAKQEYRHYDGAQGLVSHPLTPFVTFTRSTTASYMGADGLLKTAAINEPRIEYDPITGECKGLLIEESRANLFKYSETFDATSWVRLRSVIGTNVSLSPNGDMNASTLTCNTMGGSPYIYTEIPVELGSTYTMSVYAKAGLISDLLLQSFTQSGLVSFKLDGTGIKGAPTGVFSGAKIETLQNGWYRLSVVITPTSTQTIRLGFTGISDIIGDQFYIWGAQLEVGSFSTSYIKTEASAVTRGADSASVTGANFSSWYRQGEGSFLGAVFPKTFAFSNSGRIFTADNGSTQEAMGAAFLATGEVNSFISSNGSAQMSQSIAGPELNRLSRCVVGYMKDDSVSVVNNALGTTDTACNMPAVDRLAIGDRSSSSRHLNGHISRLTYWPKRLTNTQIQELSK